MTLLKIGPDSLSSSFTDTDFPACTYLYNLVPKLKDLSRTSFYSYKGSLTTPPCYQSVSWIVLKKAISAGEEEVTFFKLLEHHTAENKLFRVIPVLSPFVDLKTFLRLQKLNDLSKASQFKCVNSLRWLETGFYFLRLL